MLRKIIRFWPLRPKDPSLQLFNIRIKEPITGLVNTGHRRIYFPLRAFPSFLFTDEPSHSSLLPGHIRRNWNTRTVEATPHYSYIYTFASSVLIKLWLVLFHLLSFPLIFTLLRELHVLLRPAPDLRIHSTHSHISSWYPFCSLFLSACLSNPRSLSLAYSSHLLVAESHLQTAHPITIHQNREKHFFYYFFYFLFSPCNPSSAESYFFIETKKYFLPKLSSLNSSDFSSFFLFLNSTLLLLKGNLVILQIFHLISGSYVGKWFLLENSFWWLFLEKLIFSLIAVYLCLS